MSTQEQREAAARAWFAEPSMETYSRLSTAMWIDALRGFHTPVSGSSMEWRSALSLWLAWAKADAAKAAPAREADALEEVVWRSPWAVYVFHATVGGGPVMHPDDTDVLDGVAKGVAADVIAAHARAQLDAAATECSDAGYYARAQLAREAAAAAPTHTDLMVPPEAIDSWLEQNPLPVEAAPIQPAALTLEQMRDALVAAGATVAMPKVGGFERPDLALAALRLWREMTVGDREALGCTLDVGDVIRAIDGLRALGVTPAVLS